MDGRVLRCSCRNRLQVCYRSTEVRYTIAELCRGPLYDSRTVVGGRSVYVNYRPAFLYKFPYDDVTTIRYTCIYTCTHPCMSVIVHACIYMHKYVGMHACIHLPYSRFISRGQIFVLQGKIRHHPFYFCADVFTPSLILQVRAFNFRY